MIHALQLLCTLSSIWLKKKSIKKSVRCPKRCQQHQDWTAAWTLLKHLSDAVSQPLNKRIQDKPTYTKTFWGDVLSSASVNLSLRRLRNIIIAAMSQLRLETAQALNSRQLEGIKKRNHSLFPPSGTFPLRIDHRTPPTGWNMSVITETHGSAFGLNEAEQHFSLITPREPSISGEEGRREAGDRKLR